MGIYTIYRATCVINGKIYIGFTSQLPEDRIYQHQKDSKRGDTCFYYAIRKYGWDSFVWDILYQSLEMLHTKDVMEEFFIRENNSFINFEKSNGYNMSLGGDGRPGLKHTEESISLMKKNRSGIPCPEWQKKFLSELYKGKPQPPHRKSSAKTYQITDPNGNDIVITNLTKFCKENNLNAGAMSQVAKKRPGYPHHKGWTCILLTNDVA
jgi:group I intron endonuclease